MPTGPLPLRVRWLKFVAANPHVPRTLVRMARDRVAAGEKYVSMRGLFEELRRRPDLLNGYSQVEGGHTCKLNNSYTRLATELVIELAPELRNVFRMR